eukprot:5944840-Pyramimonas_sp.AAC.1
MKTKQFLGSEFLPSFHTKLQKATTWDRCGSWDYTGYITLHRRIRHKNTNTFVSRDETEIYPQAPTRVQ